jgi:hypothetical protein
MAIAKDMLFSLYKFTMAALVRYRASVFKLLHFALVVLHFAVKKWPGSLTFTFYIGYFTFCG